MNKILKHIYQIRLNHQQKKIDKLYEKEGLTDEILTMQIELNQKRNELNISDKTKKIYKNYAQ